MNIIYLSKFNPGVAVTEVVPAPEGVEQVLGGSNCCGLCAESSHFVLLRPAVIQSQVVLHLQEINLTDSARMKTIR